MNETAPTTSFFIRQMDDPTPWFTPYVAIALFLVLAWLLWFRLKLHSWMDYAIIFYGMFLFAFIGMSFGYYPLTDIAFFAWFIGFACAMMHLRTKLHDDGRDLSA